MTAPDLSDFQTIGDWFDDAPLTGALLIPVDRSGRVLLQLRDYGTTRYPGQWGFFGGKVEDGEDLVTAAVREFEEEAGVVIAPGQLTPKYRTLNQETRSHLYIFEAHLDVAPSDIRLGEGAGFAFVGVDDFGKLDLAEVTEQILNVWRRVR